MGLFSRNKRIEPLAVKSYATYQLVPHVTWQPKWTAISNRLALEHAMQRSTWVYACTRLRAVNVASIPFVTERYSAGEWQEATDSRVARLLRRPNPAYDWSALIRQAMYMLDLTGDAWFTVIRNGAGEVSEVWPIFPDKMEVLPGSDRMVANYRYTKSGRTEVMPSENVLHLRYTNPSDMYYGLSPLQAAARAVDIDEEAERWQKTSLQNMGVPPTVVELQGDVTQEQYEQASKWVKEQSGPEHARKPWVLAGAQMKSVAQTASDLDFIDGRKMAREEICAAYSVPPPLVGIYENATLSNIETARQILWREGLIPVLSEITAQLNLQLVSDPNERIVYDLSNVEALRENMTEKLQEASALHRLGVPLSVINEHLELGLPTDEIEGADTGYLPSGLFPVGDDFADLTPGTADDAEAAFGTA